MRVDRAIKLLQRYNPDEELMITWAGSERFETSAGVWKRAVELFDAEDLSYEFHDYVGDLVRDAQLEHDIKLDGLSEVYLQQKAEASLG